MKNWDLTHSSKAIQSILHKDPEIIPRKINKNENILLKKKYEKILMTEHQKNYIL